jgi:assimilatory nitrate reductase electron transfer subunit
VVRDGVVTGALLLGDLTTAGVVTQSFDRGRPLAADRLHLLFSRVGSSPVADPATLPDDAVVCTCNAVTAGTLRRSGCRTVEHAAGATRATTGCGSCTDSVRALLEAAAPPPVLVPERRSA